MNRPPTIQNKNYLYNNTLVYSSDMIPLFRSGIDKVNWYLNHPNNLAEIIEKNEDGTIKSIRLTFEPNGYGHSNIETGEKDAYYLSEKRNMCVISGCEDWTKLTKHHIVPAMFWKHYPLDVKTHKYHDIVLVPGDLHYVYENIHATHLKTKMARELNLPTINEWYVKHYGNLPKFGGVNSLLYHSDVIPPDRLEILKDKFKDMTGLEATKENLIAAKNNYNDKERKRGIEYGKMFMEHVTDLQAFTERWRQHFVDAMNPQHMPDGWSVKRNIYLNVWSEENI